MKFPDDRSAASQPPASPSLAAFTLRSFAPGDVAAVAALEAVCNSQPWSAAALRSPPGTCVGLVAVMDDRVAGYVLATHAADEGEILILGVDPAARRKGMAKALLQEALVRLRAAGARAVFLEVRRGNKPALALYRGLGFGEAGVRKGYYADTGEDAVLMHVFLKRG